MFVTDGAGSAARGGEGAELAIDAAVTFVADKVERGGFMPSAALATDVVRAARERIHAVAESQKLEPRDFACTFLGVLTASNGTLVLQVGDGGVVIDTGAGLDLAVVPMSGEYANMTYFVTDENAEAVLETKIYPDRALKVAVFTDGIQRLALDLATNSPYVPFFRPFFDGMAKATEEQQDQLERLLRNFLASQAVNERTDDDKTFALALWTNE